MSLDCPQSCRRTPFTTAGEHRPACKAPPQPARAATALLPRRYGTPDVDSAYKHWNHEVLPHWTEAVSRQHPIGKRFRPPDELHSPFYPLGGPYSSSDAAAVRRQMRQLRGAGVGVVVASWWGPAWRKGSTDTQASLSRRHRCRQPGLEPA